MKYILLKSVNIYSENALNFPFINLFLRTRIQVELEHAYETSFLTGSDVFKALT